MEFTLHYFDGLLEVKTFGEAECVKFREILESMVNHEKWNLGTPFLINHSNLNSGNLTVTDIQSIAEFNLLYKDKITSFDVNPLLTFEISPANII